MFGRESDHNLVDLFLRLLQTIFRFDFTYRSIKLMGRYSQYVDAFGLSFRHLVMSSNYDHQMLNFHLPKNLRLTDAPKNSTLNHMYQME